MSALYRRIVAIVLGTAFSFGGNPCRAVEPAIREDHTEQRKLPGIQPAGDILLPTQWSLRPAGQQIGMGDFPVQVVTHPVEPFLAVLHAGYGEHEIVIVGTDDHRIVSRVTIPQAFYGLCFSADGGRLYSSGGDQEVVHAFQFADGYLSHHERLRVGDMADKYVPAGIAADRAGSRLFVACPWGNTVCVLPLSDGATAAEPQHVSLPAESYPYAVLPTADESRLFVSLWGAAAVAVIDLSTQRVIDRWDTPSHPTEMVSSPDEKHLFVACANSNQVAVFDVASGQCREVIATSLYPTAPNGSTPNSVALSADGRTLLVANANNNNVAVVDVTTPGQSRSLGFVPVGWYPTSVRFSADQATIYVANGKGLTSRSNRHGPRPGNEPPSTMREYIAGLMRGTLSVIPVPSPAEMADYTRQAYACSPLRRDIAPSARSLDDKNPIPAALGEPSPIKYCVYIIKENRTYDQLFGDLPQGNGDASLCLFPRHVTPNHHALVEQFVLLDNFYVESEVSADGHEWTMAAYATDFVEKTWPLLYRGSRRGKLGYPAEGAFEIATPAGGYLFDRCAEANVSYYSFGEFVRNGAGPDPPSPGIPSLEGHFDPQFRGYDLDYTDVDRAARFIEKLQDWERAEEMPRFVALRLPNDHTYGTRPGKYTPTAMVADNDLALGRVVEALSHSRFWPQLAIFVVQDDAQNGSDHVDAHRTVALAISPYIRRGTVDSSFYSTSSMLRTMELILGLSPMSQFDAAARPMFAAFQAVADGTPYHHLPANVDLEARNSESAPGARVSLKLDFSREDAAHDLILNQIVWQSVRGADSTMPPPVRASFVFAHMESDESLGR